MNDLPFAAGSVATVTHAQREQWCGGRRQRSVLVTLIVGREERAAWSTCAVLRAVPLVTARNLLSRKKVTDRATARAASHSTHDNTARRRSSPHTGPATTVHRGNSEAAASTHRPARSCDVGLAAAQLVPFAGAQRRGAWPRRVSQAALSFKDFHAAICAALAAAPSSSAVLAAVLCRTALHPSRLRLADPQSAL